MNYETLDIITSNAKFTQNDDGSITASNIIVYVGIIGSPPEKFIQTDIVPDFIIPSTTTNAENGAYIDAQVQDYVTKTYPNT